MFANALENWLTVVAALSIFGSLQAYLSTNTLKDRQFSLAKNEVSPIARRLFGAWTLVASLVRLQCAMDSTNKAIYQTTIGTFLVAFGVYGYECFVAKTVPFKHALPPFIVAGTSLVWMLFFH